MELAQNRDIWVLSTSQREGWHGINGEHSAGCFVRSGSLGGGDFNPPKHSLKIGLCDT